MSSPSELEPIPREGGRVGVGAAALVLIVLLEGVYSAYLQSIVYRTSAPFFDSMVYYNFLAEIWWRVRSSGLIAGLRMAWDQGTILLPWLEAALLAPFSSLSRSMAIWLQIAWLIPFALSVYYFLVRHRGASPWIAFCLTVPFLSFRLIYEPNSGLSDFRFDLSLYLFTGLASVWYLATYRTNSRTPWILSGCSAALACLARGTAPVYLGVMLGPLVVVRVAAAPADRRRVLQGVGWMSLPVLLVAIPALAVNWQALVSYYTVTNADATAHLPLRQSALHFFFVGQQIGLAMAIPLTAAFLTGLIAGVRRARSFPEVFAAFDWKSVWLAIAPAGFLVLYGTGLNPYVCLPSVLGVLLFLQCPFGRKTDWKHTGRLLAAFAILGSVLSAMGGPANHRRPVANVPPMPAIRETIDAMRATALDRGLKEVSFFAGEWGTFLRPMLFNVLIFEDQAVTQTNAVKDRFGIRYQEDTSGEPEFVFAPVHAGHEWEAIGAPLQMNPHTVLHLYRRR